MSQQIRTRNQSVRTVLRPSTAMVVTGTIKWEKR